MMPMANLAGAAGGSSMGGGFLNAMLGGGMMGAGILSGIGANRAGNTQAQSNLQAGILGNQLAQQAAAQAGQYFNQGLGYISPYANTGTDSLNMLMGYMKGGASGIGGGGNSLMEHFAPTIERLEQTPGYQFTLDQGLKSVQNSAAAKGLGISGNAVKAGTDYATGLASTTFQQMLDNYLKQNQAAFNMMFEPAKLGGQAAQSIMSGATQTGANVSNALTEGAKMLSGGVMGAGNARAQGQLGMYQGFGNALSGLPLGLGYNWGAKQ